MSVSIAHKASVYSGTNATSYATGSWTPTANRLALCTVQSELSGTPSEPTTVTGNGITWVKIAGYLDDSSGTQSRITIYIGLTGVSPSAGAVTADFVLETELGCNIIVDEIDGGYILGIALDAIVQSKTGTVNGSGTSETITLDSAITSGNASYGVFHHQAAEATTEGSGYTELGDGSHSGPSSALQSEYKATGSTTVDASWTTSSGKGGIALEIKAGGTAYTQSVSGGITPSGTVGKQDNKSLSGSVSTITGSIIRQGQKTLSGAISSIVGITVKQTNKILSGSVSSISGTLSSIRLFVASLSGSITPSGTVTKQTDKPLSGSAVSSGQLVKQSNKILSASISIAGAVVKSISKSLSGTVSPIVGTVVKQTSKLFSGSISSAGETSRQTSKSVSGNVSLSGSVIKSIGKIVSGIISSIVGTISSLFTPGSNLPVAGEGEPVLALQRETYSVLQRNTIKALERETYTHPQRKSIKSGSRENID